MIDGIEIVEQKPWLLDVWEPLNTKAPCPDKTQPYCCYIRTVIFYVNPYIVRPWHHFWRDGRGKLCVEKPGGMFEEWDRVEHRITWDTPIEWKGETFLCGGGTVIWRKGRGWWMKFWARRKRSES